MHLIRNKLYPRPVQGVLSRSRKSAVSAAVGPVANSKAMSMAVHALSHRGVRFAVAALAAAGALHAAAHASPLADRVSLSESTMTWSTVKYATDAENGLVSGSLDTNTIVDRTFRVRVLENRYL